jgi:hypothetical protein
MAVKKKVDEVTPTPVKGGDWDKMVTIRLPRAEGREENSRFVCVNGRGFHVKRGVTVEVPAPVAEVLQHSDEMQDAAQDYIEQAAD